LVKELQRYRVTIAGLQETKWFESDVWQADNGWVFLHAGKPLPSLLSVVMVWEFY